ncbi:PyridoxaL 5'-Phosphate dependent protein [Giardia lamblia P15]|uniref:PyridoxaL 5'-Phosphate dependent protein n=1 Tax=Giardia intestinalis (strain P15) TaxID=658858 RepID=E1F5D2_GIAIA|nr:PyridoxaL 5'-Phosphate dependent protein [Giardia lamblia P15]
MSGTAEVIKKPMLFFRDGHCTTVEGTTADVLSTAPQGAYTRFCTVQRNRILYLAEHVTRLRKSLLGMLDDRYIELYHLSIPNMTKHRQEAENKFTESFLAKYMMEAADCILKHTPTGDVRVDVHLSAYEPGFPMFALGTPIPNQSKAKDAVILERGERRTPTIKDTQWIKERKPLENFLGDTVEEIVLMDDEGYLYEGISSNFFVLLRRGDKELVLQTAEDEYVLQGTVRSMVLSIAKSLNVLVEMSRPRVVDITKWVGVFITSTTRRVKPISRVFLNGVTYDFTTDESSRFQDAIKQSEFSRGSLITTE